MLDYPATIAVLAEQAFEIYMDGGLSNPAGIDLVARIYGKSDSQVSEDVDQGLTKLIDEHAAHVKSLRG